MAARLPKLQNFEACQDHTNGVFSSLPEEEISWFNQATRLVKFEAGSTIFSQGMVPFGCYYLCQGRVQLIKSSANGKTRLVRIVRAGDFFGIASLCDREYHIVSAVAAEESWVRFLPKGDFLRILEKYPSISSQLIRKLARDLSEMVEELSVMTFCSVRERLIRALLKLVEENGEELPSRAYSIPSKIYEAELAGMVGASREKISRELSELENQGWILYKRHVLTICNPNHLQMLICDQSK